MACELTNPNGVTVCVDVLHNGDNISMYSFPLHFNKRLTASLSGNATPDVKTARYISLIKAGEITLDGLVTHEFALNEIN